VHTAFLEGDLSLPKSEIDEAYKDRSHKRFRPEYSISLSLFNGSFEDAMKLEGLPKFRPPSHLVGAESPSDNRRIRPRFRTFSILGRDAKSSSVQHSRRTPPVVSPLGAFGYDHRAISCPVFPRDDSGVREGKQPESSPPCPMAASAQLGDDMESYSIPGPRSAPSNITLASTREVGIVPGLATGLREMALTQRFGELMARACPDCATFTRGEVIIDAGRHKHAQLALFVVEGQVSCVSLDQRPLRQSALGMQRHQRDDEVVGVGQLFGVLETMGTGSSRTRQVVFKAKSSTVRVRALRLDSSADGVRQFLSTVAGAFQVPHLSGLSGTEKCNFYEFLARYATNLTNRLSKTQLDLASFVRSKRHREQGTDKLDAKMQLTSAIITRNQLPITETALLVQACTQIEKGKKVDGHLILLSNWLVFTPLVSTGQQDIVMQLHNITSMEGQRETLSVSAASPERVERLPSPSTDEASIHRKSKPWQGFGRLWSAPRTELSWNSSEGSNNSFGSIADARSTADSYQEPVSRQSSNTNIFYRAATDGNQVAYRLRGDKMRQPSLDLDGSADSPTAGEQATAIKHHFALQSRGAGSSMRSHLRAQIRAAEERFNVSVFQVHPVI